MDSSNAHLIRIPKLPIHDFSGRIKQTVNRITRPGKSKALPSRHPSRNVTKHRVRALMQRAPRVRDARRRQQENHVFTYVYRGSRQGSAFRFPRGPRERERSLANRKALPSRHPSRNVTKQRVRALMQRASRVRANPWRSLHKCAHPMFCNVS